MAYQNVGTPRFYVDHIQYLKATNFDFISHYNNTYYTDMNEGNGDGNGYGVNTSDWSIGATYTEYPDIFTLEPSRQKDMGWVGFEPTVHVMYVPASGTGLEGDNIGRYVAVLNHNAEGKVKEIYHEMSNQTLEGDVWTQESVSGTETELLNSVVELHKNGTTIFTQASTEEAFAPVNNNICYSKICFTVVDSEPQMEFLYINLQQYHHLYNFLIFLFFQYQKKAQ